MKNLILVIGLLLSFLSFDIQSLAADATKAAKIEFAKIHSQDLEKIIKENKNLVIFDANTDDTRTQVGIIPGAHLLNSSSDYDVNKELPSDKNTALVFYCANEYCTASHSAANRALQAGYTHVSVMVDGIYGWKKAGKKVSTVKVDSKKTSSSGAASTNTSSSSATTSTASPTITSSTPAVTKEELSTKNHFAIEMMPKEVFALLKGKEAVVVDVRENEERHKIVADSLWFPFSQIDNKTQWQSFQTQLPKSKMIIFYCASGRRAKSVADQLAREGYRTAFFESPNQWQKEGLPLVDGPAK